MSEPNERHDITDSKAQLLDSYCHYSSYVRKIESVLQLFPRSSLAEVEFVHEFGVHSKEMGQFPWDVNPLPDKQKQIFQDMTQNNFPRQLGNYCHISLGYTTAAQTNQKEILTVPSALKAFSSFVAYPTPFDRYCVLHNEELKLKDAIFAVAGKYAVTYNYDCGDITLADAFNCSDFSLQFQSMLYMTTVIDRVADANDTLLSDTKAHRITLETYTSTLLKPVENMLLNIMGRTAETGQNLLRKIYRNDDCLIQAENNHLIPSAKRFTDYLNIRHLLHHQADTLTCLSKFIPNNKYVHDRGVFLDAYRQLCDNTLTGRIQAYVGALDDLRHLVQKFYPNLLSRQKGESNSKFVERIKKQLKENPDQDLMLEMNYPYKNEKTHALFKNLNKLFPEIKIIDAPETKEWSFGTEIDAYDKMNYFLMKYQDMENYINFYNLVNGHPQQKLKALGYLQQKEIVDEKTVAEINEMRELRNRLSHNYFTPELADILQQNNDRFLTTAQAVIDKLDEITPAGNLQHDAVFRFINQDGKVVDIDFNENKIVGIYLPQAVQTNRTEEIKKKEDTRESSGKVTLPDGTKIDYNSQKISLADGAIFYFNSNEHYNLSLRNSNSNQKADILLDKNMTVSSCIINGSRISVRRGDTFSVASYMIMLDRQGKLAKYIYTGSDKKRQIVSFAAAGRNVIKLSDGVMLDLNKRSPSPIYNRQTNTQTNQGRK